MIDCSLLLFKNNQYLIPTIAIAEAIILPKEFAFNRHSKVVGSYEWQQQNIYVATLDLLPLADTKIKNPKIAILHSMQKNTAYVAVLFEGQVKRLRISQESIEWADALKKLAIVSDKKVRLDVVLPDIMAIGHAAQSGSQSQISK
ncbi:MAG: hypothetical protein AB7I18_13515 [Candidatus Berkiella sp.]